MAFSEVGMMNWGYWTDDTEDVTTSQVNLIHRMVKGRDLQGKRLLDIGCGVGGTAILLDEFYGTGEILGINISASEVELAKKLSIQKDCSNRVTFQQGNASRLTCESNSFDYVIAVECAFHFENKREFISEVARVLKPGGELIFSDVSLTEDASMVENFRYDLKLFYIGLCVPHLAPLSLWRKYLQENSFSSPEIENITEHSAISLKQVQRNAENPRIQAIQDLVDSQNSDNRSVSIQWKKGWYLLMGRLAEAGVIQYNIISACLK